MHMLGWNWIVAAVARPNPSLGEIVRNMRTLVIGYALDFGYIYIHKLGQGIETEQRCSPRTNSVRAGIRADWDPKSPDG